MASNPSDRLSDKSPFAVNPVFMARVDQVAGWAIDAGLTVVINAHHENWIRTLTGSAMTAQLPRFEALWTQIAQHFAGWPPQLVFEILNEPQPPAGSSTGGMSNADLKVLNQDILNIIRKYDPTRVVIVGADQYNSLFSLVSGTFNLPVDSALGGPYLIATFHNYNPWSFAGQSSGTWGSADDIASMTGQLAVAATWGEQNHVPIYMGEYGVILQYQGLKTDAASRLAWYTQVTKIARADGISMALWDDFGDFKLYDRSHRTFDSEILKAVLQ
jgi:endoglucanase